MVADLPVGPHDPGQSGVQALSQETESCPRCGSLLVVTDDAEVCRQCPYLLLILVCAACEARERWQYGVTPWPRWWRLRPMAQPQSITVCSGTCGLLVLNQLSKDRRIPVEPQAPQNPEPTP
jgi:ribosomal protein S27AE